MKRYREPELLKPGTRMNAEWTYERFSEILSRKTRVFRRYTERIQGKSISIHPCIRQR